MEINISEGNKLILEFMGIKPKKTGGWSYEDAPFFYCNYPTYDECLEAMISYVKYHSSWDWLMKVVEKIESLRGVSVYIGKNRMNIQHSVEISYESNTWKKHPSIDKTIFIQHVDKLQAVYQAIVEFIKWHNEQSNKEGI